ncbi:MAG: hypothetical protein EHM41_19230 [Chloroflexi bacterium]|nr:MAG: hypothetical protein EHM41_19230 [Chloroflexota bacterium]
MDTSIGWHNLWKRYIALPQDHGSWVFLFSPLLIGLFLGESWNTASFVLVIAVVAAFLVRQPLTIAVKVFSGRRSRRDLVPAAFWTIIYSVIGVSAALGLVLLGYGYLLVLAIPGLPVFIWHLYLVSQRAERRQLGIELVATGVLALSTPAGYWIGQGASNPMGWLLWLLVWFQSAASIVHAYMRLEQREWKAVPPLSERLFAINSITFRALLYTTFNLIGVSILSILKIVPLFLFVPYLVQWIETVWGSVNPAVGKKPTAIGIRQLIVSTIFTVLFIAAWRLSTM